MKLVNTDYCIDMELDENSIQVLTIENALAFRQLVGDLWNEVEGGYGTWVLSEDNNTLLLSKSLAMVFNPYIIDANDKKVVSKLYAELNSIINESYIKEAEAVNGNIVSLLSNVTQEVPYFIDFRTDMDALALFKVYNIRIDVEYNTLLERIVDYIRAFHSICNIRVFVFVDLKNYLSMEEIKQLYEFVIYEKIFLMLIEGHQSDFIDAENRLILDKDLCIIKT